MMPWRVWLLGLALLAGCTKSNSAACTQGSCTDPAFPICDVTGNLDGVPGVCVAVMCTAGTFQGCQDTSTSLLCNAGGDGYDPIACPNGCDPNLGCRSCAPGQTACANGVTETCDASGNITSNSTCVLACSADATRCTTIVPSNGLGTFFAMTSTFVDQTFSGTLDLKDDKLTFEGTTTTLTAFTVAAPAGGAPIRVFVGKRVVLGDLSIVDTTVAESPGGVGFAVAFLATENLTVMGRVAVTTGAVDLAGCTGGSRAQSGSFVGGAGGGGHAGAGAAGGGVPTQVTGGAAGSASGTDVLVPLRGGCPGGNSATALGEHGGGAIQLVSETSIVVIGTIVADGTPSITADGGGGGGGGILLEAPTVTLDPTAKLLARGGGGIDGSAQAIPVPPDDASAPPGATCATGAVHCGNGGSGAAPMAPATPGGDTDTPPTTTTTSYAAGSGGGGIGRIRINTKNASYVTSATVITAAALTAGVVGSQ